MDNTPSTEKISLFAHPLTFALTHLVFPVLATLACAYLFWVTCDALEGRLATKALAVLLASAALPLSALGVLLLRPRRLHAGVMFAYAFLGVAFLYLAVPVLGEMARAVDNWIIGPTPLLAVFAGTVPLIFAGVARLATADWRMGAGADALTSLLCVFAPPFAVFLVANASFRFLRFLRDLKLSPFVESLVAHALAVGYFLGCAVFFIGLLRLLHKLFTAVTRGQSDGTRRVAGAAFFGLALPLAGLALNLRVPFPADFANPWAWGLAVVTGLVLFLPARDDARGLLFYFLKFAVAPFVLYFFVLFVPFLPLSILAILAMGAGFLILAPTLLFRHWTYEVYVSYTALRPRFSRARLVAVALAGALVLPLGFALDVERERRDVKALLAWHTEEDFDAPPAPLPVSRQRAEQIMKGINDYTFGAEIPFLSAWRTWRVYDGMYMADALRNELNRRILGRTVEDERDWEGRARNFFGGGVFGLTSARRSSRRGARGDWFVRPRPADAFTAAARPAGAPGEPVFTVAVAPRAEGENHEFIADLELPAGAWIEGMRLKMTNGVWKTARPSERKAAEWVYEQITRQRLDPSLVTLDTPTRGTLKVFPVGRDGREVELTIRLPAPAASPYVVKLDARPVANPLYPDGGAPALYTADGAAVSVVPEAWMAAHAADCVPVSFGDEETYDATDPELMPKLRRRLRQAATSLAAEATGRLPALVFTSPTNDLLRVALAPYLSGRDRATLRRELPGLESLGDRPLDGWFFLDGADGGKVAVPYRKGGGGAVVFASLAGAEKIGGAWAAGAQAWALENTAFLKPARDVRRELLDVTRRTGTLTTKSAYIVVETAAQEKGLKQKEMEALHGNQSLDFDESTAEQTGDAPGFLILLALFAPFALWRRNRPAGATAAR